VTNAVAQVSNDKGWSPNSSLAGKI
jgi:hypothetical protein